MIIKKIKQLYEDNKLLLNRKGFSTGFTWVFAIVSLFGLGILYIVFEQVFSAYLVPVITGLIDASPLINVATKAEVTANIAQYMTFFRALPLIIFLIVIIYMFVAAIRKERESQFF